MTDVEPNEMFLGLVSSLQMSAWMQLGKMMNPMTGKVERDLEHAKSTIDLLGMLEEKTRGNLHPDESKLLSRLLFDLRMNYVEEVDRDHPVAAEKSGAPESGGAAREADASSAAASPQPASGGSPAAEQPSSQSELPGAMGSEGGGTS